MRYYNTYAKAETRGTNYHVWQFPIGDKIKSRTILFKYSHRIMLCSIKLRNTMQYLKPFYYISAAL